MRLALAFDIAQLALYLARDQSCGTPQRKADVTNMLLTILRKGAEAYSAHTGDALDPDLIKPEEPV